MSKSLGNVVAPQEVSDKLGAEILRLWVAATDYSGELSISRGDPEARGRSLSPLRNTLRFLLANTADFDRRCATRCAGRPMAGDRPLRAGLHPPPAGAVRGRLRRASSSTGGAGAA
jgi:isoleucyl-tRNA synthetase